MFNLILPVRFRADSLTGKLSLDQSLLYNSGDTRHHFWPGLLFDLHRGKTKEAK